MTHAQQQRRQQGLKRGRQAIGDAEPVKLISHAVPTTAPSREARVAWNDDFPAKFQVLDKIGEGSFGSVWLGKKRNRTEDGNDHDAERREEEGLVAIKRINPTCSPSRILNEFEQMKKLRGGESVVVLPADILGFLVLPVFFRTLIPGPKA